MRILSTLYFIFSIAQLNGQLDHRYKSWEENQYIVTASMLNVRDANNDSGKVIDQIPLGTKVMSFEETIPANREQKNLDFAKVEYRYESQIKQGYVSTRYLSQFYSYDMDNLLFIKDISDGREQEMSLISKQNGLITEIGRFKTDEHINYSIRIRHTKRIDNIRRVIEVDYEDFDSCSGGHSFHTYVHMKDGSYSKLPFYGYTITESGENVIDLQMPDDPYGKDNRLNIIEIEFDYTDHGTKVNKINIIHEYRWNGSEWVAE